MHNIAVNNVTMDFGKVTALKNISVSFEENKIYGLLGRNGAGKSTMLSVISNRIFPTSGEVLVDGETAHENNTAQSKIFYMGEKNVYPDNTTVKLLYRWTKDFYPGFDTEYAYALAQKFHLDTKKKLKSLSTGYMTIARLTAALATDVPFVFFDEPVLGLDANHRELFYHEMLARYMEKPRTIILSTHLIEEIANIIEQVVIINKGELMLAEEAAKVKQMGYMVSGKAADVDAFAKGKDIIAQESLGGLKSTSILGQTGEIPPELEVSALDLQKLFVRLTNDQEGER